MARIEWQFTTGYQTLEQEAINLDRGQPMLFCCRHFDAIPREVSDTRRSARSSTSLPNAERAIRVPAQCTEMVSENEGMGARKEVVHKRKYLLCRPSAE